MKNVFLSIGAIATVMASLPGDKLLAQEPNCQQPMDQTTMNICAGLEFRRTDKKFNNLYQKLLKKLADQPQRKAKLIKAQQQWIKFRDSSCEFEKSEVEGGSMSPLIYAGCLTKMTEQRIGDFQEYIKSLEER
jgi:uncharacterized protein YecT (DUF1311 family)